MGKFKNSPAMKKHVAMREKQAVEREANRDKPKGSFKPGAKKGKGGC